MATGGGAKKGPYFHWVPKRIEHLILGNTTRSISSALGETNFPSISLSLSPGRGLFLLPALAALLRNSFRRRGLFTTYLFLSVKSSGAKRVLTAAYNSQIVYDLAQKLPEVRFYVYQNGVAVPRPWSMDIRWSEVSQLSFHNVTFISWGPHLSSIFCAFPDAKIVDQGFILPEVVTRCRTVGKLPIVGIVSTYRPPDNSEFNRLSNIAMKNLVISVSQHCLKSGYQFLIVGCQQDPDHAEAEESFLLDGLASSGLGSSHFIRKPIGVENHERFRSFDVLVSIDSSFAFEAASAGYPTLLTPSLRPDASSMIVEQVSRLAFCNLKISDSLDSAVGEIDSLILKRSHPADHSCRLPPGVTPDASHLNFLELVDQEPQSQQL